MKVISYILTLFIFCSVSLAQAAEEPIIKADSAILIEATTGRVIYEKNADEKRPPASMTKMMTSILCLENIIKRTPVSISESAVYTEDNTFEWQVGDIIMADELNLGMMLVSDNGGAVAIAQAVAGSVDEFAVLMNEKAAQLGCTNTHFANPNGLPNSNHYSTARDMSRIAMYCMQNYDFRDIVSMKKAVIHWMSPATKWTEAETTNDLIGVYDGANGIKTGWTNAAGGCLAASAKRGNVELIAIIMHSTDVYTRFDDAKKLLDYGFNRITMTQTLNKDRVEKIVFIKGGKQAVLHVRPQDDLHFPLLDGEDANKLKISYELPKLMDAGVKKGQIVGNANLKYNGKVIASVPMIAQETIDKGFSITSTLVGFVVPVMNIFFA